MSVEQVKEVVGELNKSYTEVIEGEEMEFEGFDIEVIDPDKNNNREKHFGVLEDTTAEIVLTAPFLSSHEVMDLISNKVDNVFLEPISHSYLGVYAD